MALIPKGDFVEVEPRAGTLVLFRSESVPHEAMPMHIPGLQGHLLAILGQSRAQLELAERSRAVARTDCAALMQRKHALLRRGVIVGSDSEGGEGFGGASGGEGSGGEGSGAEKKTLSGNRVGGDQSGSGFVFL